MKDTFPALVRRPGWTYLDSAATCLLPQGVIDIVTEAMAAGGSAGRASHQVGSEATEAYEAARVTVAAFLGAMTKDVVFVRSATEGLNLLAAGWGGANLRAGDRVVVTALEHHSNLLPWRAVVRDTGALLDVARADAHGDLDLGYLATLLERKPRVLALTHVSNVTGAVVPVAQVVSMVRAHAPDCLVVVDGTQAVPHLAVDVAALGADAYVFSGHKAYGPGGAGVVWAKTRRWEEVEPHLWGGGMVAEVGARSQVLVEGPWRFEAGTPNHVAVVGLGAGLQWCGTPAPVGGAQLTAALAEVEGCRLLGSPQERVGIVSFILDGVHPHDIATVLDREGVAVRSGRLCAHPYLAHLGVQAAVRASVGAFTTQDDVQRLVDGLKTVRSRFGGVR